MPLTECPDCGGVVSDQALTCPTCHRVLSHVDTQGVVLARRMIRWAFGGVLVLVGLWVLMQIAS